MINNLVILDCLRQPVDHTFGQRVVHGVDCINECGLFVLLAVSQRHLGQLQAGDFITVLALLKKYTHIFSSMNVNFLYLA